MLSRGGGLGFTSRAMYTFVESIFPIVALANRVGDDCHGRGWSYLSSRCTQLMPKKHEHDAGRRRIIVVPCGRSWPRADAIDVRFLDYKEFSASSSAAGHERRAAPCGMQSLELAADLACSAASSSCARMRKDVSHSSYVTL